MDKRGRAPKPYISPKARAQQMWLFVHRWLGIVLLVPMALLGLTGSALVWPEQTELLVNPDRVVAADADPAQIEARHVEAASAAMAEHGPLTAALIGDVGYPMTFGTAPVGPPNMGLGPPTRMAVYVDPVSGDAIDTKRSTGDFMWFMHAIHGHLLLSGVGRPVVGFMGLFLIVSAVTGLVVWWPGRKKIIAALKWRKWEGKTLNLHRQSGVVLSLVLVVEAVTGAWISFPNFFAAVVEPGAAAAEHSHGPPPRAAGAPTEPVSFSGAEWESALIRARAAHGGRPSSIQAPATVDGTWQITMLSEQGEVSVQVPQAGGATVVEQAGGNAGRAEVTAHVMEGIHAGAVGGPVWQWLTFLSGFVLAFLSFSGIYIWGKREVKRLLKRRR